jgi:hypothetical protein
MFSAFKLNHFVGDTEGLANKIKVSAQQRWFIQSVLQREVCIPTGGERTAATAITHED